MIIGNGMNGAALALERFSADLKTKRAVVEARLSLGATGRQATRDILRSALSAAMIPIVNSLMTVGIVYLPGLMTGQILSGVSPLTAVKYQIVIMFMVTAAVALCAISVLHLSARQYLTPALQIREQFT